MGRNTNTGIDDEDVALGCTWGMLHLLDYHLWRSRGIKKVLLRKRRDQRMGNKQRNEKPKDPNQISRRQETSDAEVITGDYEAAFRNRSKTNTISAPLAKDISNKMDGVEDQTAVWSELFSKLRHLLVPKPHKPLTDPNEVPILENVNPSEDLSELMPLNFAELKRCLTHKEFKENLDVLGLFDAKNPLFQRALHGADAVLPSWLLSGNKVSPEDVRLSKSASFPRFKMPIKLGHKHNEVWPLPNVKKPPSTPEDNRSHHLDAKDSSRSSDIKILKIRRSASLTESIDRYNQLLDYSFDKEMTRRLSKSLKVRNEKEYAFGEYAPKSLRRGLSSRDHLHSSNFVPNEASRVAFSAENPLSTALEDSCGELVGSHESTEDTEAKSAEEATMLSGQEEAVDAMPGVETMLASDKEKSSIAKEDVLPGCMKELPIQQDDLEKVVDSTSFQISHGSCSESGCAPSDSSDTGTMLCSNAMEDSASRTGRTLPVGYVDNLDTLESLSDINKGETLDTDDLHYVKYILQLSGLMSKDEVQTRRFLEQPLDEALCEEVEADLYPKLSCSSKSVGSSDSCLHRKLLFDLIDEALLEIFNRSCTRYPKALSSSCQVRRVPMGIDVFKDVRAYIITYLSIRPVLDSSSDGAVAHDLSKNSGWMSLQHDSESVALQLEDLIFKELLDEVIG